MSNYALDYQIFAIDHGNASIKTPNHTFPCNLSQNNTLPTMTDQWILYNGVYYSLDTAPGPFMEDKTINNTYLILTLFGIAMEIKKGWLDRDKDIVIAAGLPPRHIARQGEKFKEYLYRPLSQGVDFVFSGEKYHIKVIDVMIFPQGYAAALTRLPFRDKKGVMVYKSQLLKRNKSFVLLDIGGLTMDIIPINNMLPIKEQTSTQNLGILVMIDKIIEDVQEEFMMHITYKEIEDVLKKEDPCYVDAEIADFIIKETRKFIRDKIEAAVKKKISNIKFLPVLVIGGGGIMLYPYLKELGLSKEMELIDDQNANAKGYYLAAKMQLKGR